MTVFDVRCVISAKAYILDLEKKLTEQFGSNQRIYWTISGQQKLLNDLTHEEILKAAEALANRQPYCGGLQ